VPDRLNRALRIVCLCLAGLVLWQISRLAVRKHDPLPSFNLPAAAQAAIAPPSTNVAKSEPVRQASSRAAQAVELPPNSRARVDRIVQSEILGALVKPQPLALLGLAGQDAFIRNTDGQTLMLREGETNSGLKLLRIGTNRVLIEHEGQQKELTLFSGFGSETLLPKNEPTNRNSTNPVNPDPVNKDSGSPKPD
jgi:hypothetical protein